MDEMIAYCGLTCHLCPACQATKANDDEKRIRTAKRWAQYYEKYRDLKPEEIVCDGCLTSNGRLFKTCKTCPVRACGIERNVANCAHCREYPCQKLEEPFALAPQGKQKLDEIRSTLIKSL